MKKELLEKLGGELTAGELRGYRMILLSGCSPISFKSMAEQYFHIDETSVGDKEIKTIWALVGRIKQKLGKTAVICIPGVGYVSRQILIQEMVARQGQVTIGELIKELRS